MPKSIYEDIYKDLKMKIEDNTFAYQELLPSENTLIQTYGCSRNTLRRAVSLLVSDGYVQTMQGKGVRKQIVVIDGEEGNQYVLINPVIEEMSGSQTGQEGCLSVPGKAGMVTRPSHVKVRALNEKMEEFVLEADDFLARAICHECDHLHGHLYVELVEGPLEDVTAEEE